MANHNSYIDRKAAGLISIAADPDNYRYVVKTRQWDANTGLEITPKVEPITLDELTTRKAGIQEALKQVNKMIADLQALPTLPEKPIA